MTCVDRANRPPEQTGIICSQSSFRQDRQNGKLGGWWNSLMSAVMFNFCSIFLFSPVSVDELPISGAYTARRKQTH